MSATDELPTEKLTLTRREFLAAGAATAAAVGFGACTRPPNAKIVPYVEAPAGMTPAKPLFFATTFTMTGYAEGVLARSDMGRPTKIEGNPDHPASLGATSAFAQASVLDLYDPDRSRGVVNKKLGASTWERFLSEWRSLGAGMRILTRTVTSPTLAAKIREFLARHPGSRWHRYEPLGRDRVARGAKLAFGRELSPVYRFGQARVVVSLDADFLARGPGQLRYAHDWMQARKAAVAARADGGAAATLPRLHALEATPGLTGAMADHRVTARPSRIEAVARGLAEAVLRGVGASGECADWVAAAAAELRRNRGAGLVIAGDEQPEAVHALAHAINAGLGNIGATVVFIEPVEAGPPATNEESLRSLVGDMMAGRVPALLILGGNPAYDAPADLGFAEALKKLTHAAHLSLYEDETSALCEWHLPEAHYLEAWSDARAYDGTASIAQPLIAPLYEGRSSLEALSAIAEPQARPGYELVREYWKKARPGGDFEAFWEKSLRDGVVAKSAFPTVSPRLVAVPESLLSVPVAAAPGAPGLELLVRPDPTVFEGSFSNNGWLQELPKPLTKLTWDNAALIGPATARRLGLVNGSEVALSIGAQSVRAPAWILMGQPEDAVTVNLGYGRERGGRYAKGAGFNAYLLTASGAPSYRQGLSIAKTGVQRELSCTQGQATMEGRDHVKVVDFSRLDRRELLPAALEPETVTLYKPYPYDGYKWGMAINLTACIGCGACVTACQAENNIPVVGRREVARGRAMHWLRVDRYYEGQATLFQPVPCMHCETAPCELVCPVAATVHDSEGVNEMVYNRCVGTRYCSNNCPYKVRRFNFFQYADYGTQSLKALRNPEVTVRSRGVMEKCTYCVQRVSRARIEAKERDERIRDGEARTACQQACPTQAIVFGDLNDTKSEVSRWKRSPLNYGLLSELGTRPRTTYLARVVGK